MEKFTKGEWGAEIDTYNASVLCNGMLIADLVGSCASEEEIDANTHLVAAAPEMYEALKEAGNFLLACEDGTMSRNNMQNLAGELEDKVFKLLAKARGE